MRRRLVLLLTLAVLVAGVLAPAARAVDRAGLRSTLAVLHHRLGPAAGAYVVDLGTGQPIFAHRQDLALAPASNEKLFVTAAALLRFGPAATLSTQLRAAPGAAVDASGVLRGDLYLVGGGDPTLGDPGLETLADDLAAAGVTRIAGAVIGDESSFDTLRGGPDSAYRPDGDLGGWLSALSWDHGRATGGSPAKAAAARLASLLKARDITYDRRPRAGALPGGASPATPTLPAPSTTTPGTSATPAQVPASDTPLAVLPSPAIRELMADTNIPSENFYAEMLTKALGAHFGAGGTTAAGLAVTRAQMAALGIHPRLVDGSGLSRADRTTPRQIVRLLTRMDGQDTSADWEASLPVAGATGTLRLRMRRSAAAGRCLAKTGTLIGVSALSGYCTTTGGVRVAFSFLENRVCASCAKRLEDRMVGAIARLDG
ncbi:D-alanyl-D-alanine carboxypeptidase/D-alanyl-D-alanine-endopeptidase [Baekduia soli]|uniref:D-alanyl-D-alanine carboxypeptidase/D-alanyl-D-alanine-endopeptidase n=1 Tax=Baekduia soli TaxID=496014 RepID=UPI0016522F57|nr:D-alanyl-D-alanine carboxypeptidase [Baekduia soli]